ncbi:MAG TPA: selenocysteine-specific translation elongation factor [Bacillota bacterium]|nr:selenocysteine-specific translation elongation factor [Bacillota bacterium]
MKNVIIGTAGHIDHGKTTLIRALTGRDTDRLKEEKTRGISIELGFTYFDLPSGRRAGIIDVPGHEKFIKNMLAGAGGIDVVVLVIAADEGVMPQTREHLNILSLLKVKKGIIALTKKDMVDQEWLEMIIEQIKEETADSFIEGAKIIPVSSVTGEGIKELIEDIDSVTEIVEEKDNNGVFRLPVDRVFTITGFGTVVTGTLISGTISEGDRVEIFPRKTETRVRSIQVHDKNVKTAYAGQRVAINIANIKLGGIQRGDILAQPGCMEPSMMLDAKLEILGSTGKPIDNRDRLRFYHGTSEIMCRVVLLDREELKPGDSAFVQLRLEEDTACMKGDRFVIRTYSPMLTIGGGTVLEPNPPKRKRYKKDTIEELKIKEQGDPTEVVERYLIQNSDKYPERKTIIKAAGNISAEIYEKIAAGLLEKKLIKVFALSDETYVFHVRYLKDIETKIAELLEAYHKRNPLKSGISKEELRTRVFEGMKPRLADLIFGYFESEGIIRLESQYVAKFDFTVKLNRQQEQIKEVIERSYRENRFNPPKAAELAETNRLDKNQCQLVYNALIDMGELVKLDEDIAISKAAYDEAIELLRKYIGEKGSIQLGQFRDLLGTSRKYAMALLDYFDQNRITKRVGDNRMLL